MIVDEKLHVLLLLLLFWAYLTLYHSLYLLHTLLPTMALVILLAVL
jgi:hypothetical protein